MYLQLSGGGLSARGQPGTPFVVIERVKRADNPLDGEEPQRDPHADFSSTSNSPSYRTSSPKGAREILTATCVREVSSTARSTACTWGAIHVGSGRRKRPKRRATPC